MCVCVCVCVCVGVCWSFSLLEWLFFHINGDDLSDDGKAVYLRVLHEMLSSDGGKSPHTPMLPVS